MREPSALTDRPRGEEGHVVRDVEIDGTGKVALDRVTVELGAGGRTWLQATLAAEALACAQDGCERGRRAIRRTRGGRRRSEGAQLADGDVDARVVLRRDHAGDEQARRACVNRGI